MNFVNGWNHIKREFPKHKFAISLVVFLFFFAIFGFIYNNLQNQNALFTSAWLYDVFALSWTNLLALPILVILVPWAEKPRDWEPFKNALKEFLASPIYWIAVVIGFRLLIKLLIGFNQAVSGILNWLAS